MRRAWYLVSPRGHSRTFISAIPGGREGALNSAWAFSPLLQATRCRLWGQGPVHLMLLQKFPPQVPVKTNMTSCLATRTVAPGPAVTISRGLNANGLNLSAESQLAHLTVWFFPTTQGGNGPPVPHCHIYGLMALTYPNSVTQLTGSGTCFLAVTKACVTLRFPWHVCGDFSRSQERCLGCSLVQYMQNHNLTVTTVPLSAQSL